MADEVERLRTRLEQAGVTDDRPELAVASAVARLPCQRDRGAEPMERVTWKGMARIFAASLADKTCTDHSQLRPLCPYCRDTGALLLYQGKLTGKLDMTWQEVVSKLAQRFQHFEECSAHTADNADPENCPFCRDEVCWRRYVDFCNRQKVQPVRRDADITAEGAVVISIFDIRARRIPR